jgi:hypothetical protein
MNSIEAVRMAEEMFILSQRLTMLRHTYMT